MKSKIRMIFKTGLTLLALFIIIFGVIGLAKSDEARREKVEIKKYYQQHPLNAKKGIAVDSDENIYIGDEETGSIQVYDSIGIFQYGFSFVTGKLEPFVFGIEQDKIHIVINKFSYFIFDRGELVSSEKEINENRRKELQAKYNMKESSSYETNNKIYKISLFNTIKITDEATGQVEKIHLNAPTWPFGFRVYLISVVAGIGVVFALHRKSKLFLLLFAKR